MYRTDEENYTRTSLVKAKAFVDEQDVTRASDQEDEDNETEVVWEMTADTAESEAGEESTDAAANSQTENSYDPISGNSSAAKLNVNSSAAAKNADGLTVYFDYSNFKNDPWFTEDNLYVHGFYSAGGLGSDLRKMIRSDRGENIFEYTFDQNYTKVIFTKGGDWNTSVSTVQGDGMAIPSEMVSPCFKLDKIDGKSCTGELV